MNIEQLSIRHFRNLTSIDLTLSPHFNLLFGQNGAGKTSIIEAIHYLGLNKSFRSHLNNRIIQHGQELFTLFAQSSTHKIGIERRSKSVRLRLNEETLSSVAPIVKALPLLVIHAHTYELLENGPENRRQFLDWGVFHVEQSFFHVWKRYMTALSQRNRALREQKTSSEVTAWNKELIEAANIIDQARKDYLNSFLSYFLPLLHALLPVEPLELNYYQGWGREKSYEEVLSASYRQDCALGYTQFGPHRADLKIFIDKTPAKDVLSRGQLKLFVTSMRLAQAELMKNKLFISPLLLIDDLPSELDENKRTLLCSVLKKLKAQIFITCVDKNLILPLIQDHSHKMFHVEQGGLRD